MAAAGSVRELNSCGYWIVVLKGSQLGEVQLFVACREEAKGAAPSDLCGQRKEASGCRREVVVSSRGRFVC